MSRRGVQTALYFSIVSVGGVHVKERCSDSPVL